MSNPLLSDEQQEHTNRVTNALHAHIESAGGSISFESFMHFALYEPGFGYYVTGNEKIGPRGDFTTAPLISSLFSACLARYAMNRLATQLNGSILELGAGTGQMAGDILLEMHDHQALPTQYAILEPSAELRARQMHTLQSRLPSSVFERITWLTSLPEPSHFSGVVFANEVMDAMPVERLVWDGTTWQQQCVSVDSNQLVLTQRPITNTRLQTACEQLPSDLPHGYTTEINLWIAPWIQSLFGCMHSGHVCLIDYGYLAQEYYHPQRHDGTLMCYFQHKAHDNPLTLLGLQDITAHVNFSATIEAAESAGFSIDSLSTQAQFLIQCGITDILATLSQQPDYHQHLPGIKQLLLPQGMGESFKALSLQKR